MNLRISRCILLLLLAGVVAFSGCTATTGPAPQAAILTPDTITPVQTTTLLTPLPVNEIARIEVDHFGMNPSTESIFEFVGKVQVNNGPYQSVQIVLRYPDSQEYSYNLGGMGGANATLKGFSLFPDDRYKGTNPDKIIVLDGKQYGTVYRNENKVDVWIARPDNLLSP